MRAVLLASFLSFIASNARAESPPPLAVKLSAVALLDGATRPRVLLPGDALRAGDQVAFEVEVNAPAFVYLFQGSPSGELNVLFPDPDIAIANPLPAGARVRIPTEERWFALDDKDLGDEDVHLVVSPRELASLRELAPAHGAPAADAGKRLGPTLAGIRDAKSPPGCRSRGNISTKVLPQKHGDDGCPRARGLKLAPKAGEPPTSSVQYTADTGDDTIFETFTFQHVAR